jgi:hypothetical protein
MKSGSWTETVYRVVIAADRLMTMDELKDAVGKVRTSFPTSGASERLRLGNCSWRKSRLAEPGISQPSVIARDGAAQFVRCSSAAPGT